MSPQKDQVRLCYLVLKTIFNEFLFLDSPVQLTDDFASDEPFMIRSAESN